MARTESSSRLHGIQNFLFSYGFLLIMVLVIALYTITAPNFLTISNAMAILQTASPLLIIASGASLVILTGKIDISVGSVAFLSCSLATMLILHFHVSILLSIAALLACGALLGMLNGFIVVFLRVNPLITTLGTMIAFRGIALEISNSQTLGLPESLRAFGNSRIGPVFSTILIALLVLVILHVFHTRTPSGRDITALGNGEEVASRLGIRVKGVSFLTFTLSGLLAGLGGLVAMCQIGSLNPGIGNGMEFTAIAAIIIGGISLFGGEGTIIPCIIFGGCTLAIIENGLNLLSASSYAYPFVRGAVIFLAMYADSLKYSVRTQRRTIEAHTLSAHPEDSTTM
jgi:ribose/xylose/arabinose/galactoside ABC-type transport system permease subunit